MTIKKTAAKKTTRTASDEPERRGRKKDPLTERVVFRCLPSEYALLERAIEESGRSMAAEVRFRLFKMTGKKL